jgi:hypothetical protein
MSFRFSDATGSVTQKIGQLSPIVRFLVLTVFFLFFGVIFLWLFEEVLTLSLSRGYIDRIAGVFNLNRHLAEALSLATFVALTFFVKKSFSFSRSNRIIGIGGVLALLIGNSVALWQGTKDQFFEASGTPTKCYVLTRDGVRYGERVGTDAATGKPCRPVNAEILERLQQYAKGKRPERVVVDDPAFFDLKTGEPVIWFSKDKSGQVELFDLMGFHPETGEELAPVARDVVQEWKSQQRAIAERPPQRIDPEKYVFFDLKNGKPRAWYWRGVDGEFEFYDNKGFQPRTGEALIAISREIIADWSSQSAKKCYVVTRDAVKFGSKLGLDSNTGRECRTFTPALLERLREYEKGNRPKRVTSKEPVFFDLRTGEPNLWYAHDERGQIQLFDLIGFHPDTGQELLPVTLDIVATWKRQTEIVTRKPPQLVKPDKFPFFDQVTGEPRVWYWRGVNGAWEFYDNAGFRSTGEPLTLVSREIIETWKKDIADRAKRDSDDVARKERDRIATIETDKRKQEAASKKQEEEAERAQREQKAGESCDASAANPTDLRKPSSVPGVEYFDLKLHAQAAVEICSTAVQKFPTEPRYKYNLARSLEFSNPTQSANLYLDLIRLKYPAAYDNYGGVLWREKKDLPAAIRQYMEGVRLNDPGAMVSVAYLIQKNLIQVPDPAGARLALLTKAAQAGHKAAQDSLEKERANYQWQVLEKPNQQETQRRMLDLFGTILGGIAR